MKLRLLLTAVLLAFAVAGACAPGRLVVDIRAAGGEPEE